MCAVFPQNELSQVNALNNIKVSGDIPKSVKNRTVVASVLDDKDMTSKEENENSSSNTAALIPQRAHNDKGDSLQLSDANTILLGKWVPENTQKRNMSVLCAFSRFLCEYLDLRDPKKYSKRPMQSNAAKK